MENPRDEEIVEEVLGGKTYRFNDLMERYQQLVFRTCLGFVHSKEDAEDISQEVFLNVYQSLSRFRGQAAFSTWLYRIAINASLNHLRKQARRQRYGLFFPVHRETSDSERQNHIASEEGNPEQDMVKKEQYLALKKSLEKLPEKQKTAFVLSRYEEMSQREIARIMNTTEGAVESLLQRAKQNLIKHFSRMQ